MKTPVMGDRRRIVVVGNGMVGHKMVQALLASSGSARLHITVLGEEPRAAYDRVNLSKYFEGAGAAALALVGDGEYENAGVALHLGDLVMGIDRVARVVTTSSGRQVPYEALVLATGSYPFVPPVDGREAPGCFVYRTIDDLEAIRAWAASCTARGPAVGVVIGGGLLGLEAANALEHLGLATHVVELAPRLMALQVDEPGGAILRGRIEALGVRVHLGKTTARIERQPCDSDGDGRVSGIAFSDGERLPAQMVVFSAGIRPRDELARSAGLAVGERGGVRIDAQCRTSDPAIFAVGECASFEGRTFGLVAPGYRMAEVAAAVIAGGDTGAAFAGGEMNTKLKLMGVDVASFGDAFARIPDAKVFSVFDSRAAVYKKLVVSPDGKRLLGGILVGDAASYGQLVAMMQGGAPLPPHPEDLILPPRADGKPAGQGVDALPDAVFICSCHNVDKRTICVAIRSENLMAVSDIKTTTKAGTGCGSCVPLLGDLLRCELTKAGVAVSNHLCEHFAHSRQELFHLIKVHQIRTFAALLARHGRGLGCEICKPAVASILASTWNEHILAKEHAGLQDTNDRFMANIQRDGTYSVVPRVPGGEITPRQLMVLGRVAERHRLYSKITGGQRVDLFGARLEQLPAIWRELIDAGFESGHAYGKALRTVKSCVGSTWCRYGVQDSVGLAIRIENRYKGLRSPHKLKSAVSGCARECAEAQGKDFGIIATEKGHNLYVCGNGGMKPQHAQLLAADLDEPTLVRYLDRFLMFYVRTADRLQRTATWFNNLEGGIEYLRQVIIDDALGIATELEADMAHIVATYQCEWRAAVDDPEKLKMFRSFINSAEPDPDIVFVSERLQHRPAQPQEKAGRATGARAAAAEAHDAE